MAKVKDKKKAKRIVKAKIDFISLCPRGANSFSTIYKADDGDKSVDLTTICKDMNEQGEIIACVYAPETIDSQGDIASAAVIKEFAHDFQKNGAGIDIRHNEEALEKDDIYVAESFIIQKDDPRFADMMDYEGNSVDVTGGWGAVLKVDSEELRELYRSGDWGGVSMGGMAIKKSTEDTETKSRLKQVLEAIKPTKKENKSKNNTENIMPLSKEDKKEMVDLVKETMVEITKSAEEAKAEKLKKELDESKGKLGMNYPAPVLKDNSPEGVEKHRKALEIYELSKEVDSTDSRAIFDFQQKASEIAKCENLEETLNKQATSVYDSYFSTNQSTDEIKKSTDLSNDPVAQALKKSNDEADKK